MRRLRGVKERRPIYSGVSGLLARAVDAAVGTVAPGLAHRMQVARIKSAALIAYEAARSTPQNPIQETGSMDAETLPDLPKLRDQSRALIRDDPHAAATLNIHEECIVADGIRPQASCTPDETGLTEAQCDEWNDACDRIWKAWADDEADATRVGSFYDLQALALRCYLTDGDAIGHAVIGGDATIACELIDADRIESPNYRDTDTIRGGVELGAHGDRQAFWILPHHPADQFLGVPYASSPVRVPFEDNGISIVQHVFKRQRAGQTRGVPLLTPALIYSKNLHHFLDSELIAARAASNFALFIKRTINRDDPEVRPVQDDDAPTGQSYIEELQPGMVEYLGEGEEPVPFNPNRPGSNFSPFVERILRATASASGLAYEVVCRDFGRMNLSSARALLREIKRGFDLMRNRLVRQFCRPWWENVIRMAVGSGKLRAPSGWRENPRAFLRAEWLAPVYGFVDPETDTRGSMLEVDANLSDQWTEAAKRGQDAETVLRRRASFYALAREIELEHGLDPGTLTKERPARSESVTPAGEQPSEQPDNRMPSPGDEPDDDEESPPDAAPDDDAEMNEPNEARR